MNKLFELLVVEVVVRRGPEVECLDSARNSGQVLEARLVSRAGLEQRGEDKAMEGGICRIL